MQPVIQSEEFLRDTILEVKDELRYFKTEVREGIGAIMGELSVIKNILRRDVTTASTPASATHVELPAGTAIPHLYQEPSSKRPVVDIINVGDKFSEKPATLNLISSNSFHRTEFAGYSLSACITEYYQHNLAGCATWAGRQDKTRCDFMMASVEMFIDRAIRKETVLVYPALSKGYAKSPPPKKFMLKQYKRAKNVWLFDEKNSEGYVLWVQELGRLGVLMAHNYFLHLEKAEKSYQQARLIVFGEAVPAKQRAKQPVVTAIESRLQDMLIGCYGAKMKNVKVLPEPNIPLVVSQLLKGSPSSSSSSSFSSSLACLSNNSWSSELLNRGTCK